ncbi:MAG: hypothetical protein EPN33_09830 [Acidobacteria bacterium]|nr:MAG: hypothetical protein EPN33_09830 [Acidobacteriota bacterium]
MKTSIVAASEAELKTLERVLEQSGRGGAAGPGIVLPVPFPGTPLALRPLLAQAPEAVLVDLPSAEAALEAALALMQWLREELPLCAVMAAGPLEAPQLIVRAMRAGASEYLERPLRPAALTEALARCRRARAGGGGGGSARGLLLAVLGARGGCGATTVAVNLALSLQAQRGKTDGPVVLLDAAPLGHAALHLNLKPQFTLLDLLSQAQRLDATLLRGMLLPHASGIALLAGTRQPLTPELAAGGAPAVCLDLLLRAFPLIVADLSTRLDELTRAVIAQAGRILLVTQTDAVALWSAAMVRQYLDTAARLRFELVINRDPSTPVSDVAALEELTKTPVLWQLPYDQADAAGAIERGEPVVCQRDSELVRSFQALGQTLLGHGEKKRPRRWPRLFGVREAA